MAETPELFQFPLWIPWFPGQASPFLLGAPSPVQFSTASPSPAAPTPGAPGPGGREAPPSPGSSSSRCGGSASAGPWPACDYPPAASAAPPSPSWMPLCCQCRSLGLPSSFHSLLPAVKDKTWELSPWQFHIIRWRKPQHIHVLSLELCLNQDLTKLTEEIIFVFKVLYLTESHTGE